MPTIVGILEFITRTNDIVNGTEQENCLNYLYFDINQWRLQILCLNELSMHF